MQNDPYGPHSQLPCKEGRDPTNAATPLGIADAITSNRSESPMPLYHITRRNRCHNKLLGVTDAIISNRSESPMLISNRSDLITDAIISNRSDLITDAIISNCSDLITDAIISNRSDLITDAIISNRSESPTLISNRSDLITDAENRCYARANKKRNARNDRCRKPMPTARPI